MLDLETSRSPTIYIWSGRNRQLVRNEPVEVRELPIILEEFIKYTRILIKENRRTSSSFSSWDRRPTDQRQSMGGSRPPTKYFCQVERRFRSQVSNRQPLPWDLDTSPPSSSSLGSSWTRIRRMSTCKRVGIWKHCDLWLIMLQNLPGHCSWPNNVAQVATGLFVH